MIRGLARPLGWSARELELAAVVARYHRGALPRARAKTLQALELADRQLAMQAAGILRLANALDLPRQNHPQRNPFRLRHGQRVGGAEAAPRLEVSMGAHSVLVRVAGYAALERSAEQVAAARHLLETVLRGPVVVRPLRARTARGKSARRMPLAGG